MTSSSEATELGTSLAAHFAREISASERNLSKAFHLAWNNTWRTHLLFERFFIGNFGLEAGSYQGPRFADCIEILLQWGDRWTETVPAHRWICFFFSSLFVAQEIIDQNKLEKPQAHTSPIAELAALKKRMAEALAELRAKESHLTVRDLKHLLFRCAATLISAPKVSNCIFSHRHCLLRVEFSVTTN